jgi:hypothetical protein
MHTATSCESGQHGALTLRAACPTAFSADPSFPMMMPICVASRQGQQREFVMMACTSRYLFVCLCHSPAYTSLKFSTSTVENSQAA